MGQPQYVSSSLEFNKNGSCVMQDAPLQNYNKFIDTHNTKSEEKIAWGANGWSEWPETIIGGPEKRIFDLLLATIGLLLISPLFLVVGLLIKLQDKGPIFYGHERIGLGGRAFSCLKFRSMVMNSDAILKETLETDPQAAREWQATRKLRKDPRITPVGRFLRASSIDELPQLINVFRGEMSLVGPRPVVAAELERYALESVHYMRVRPGVTGLWQVSGRSNVSYKRRVLLDKKYILQWSFMQDIKIIAMTIPALLLKRGAV